jgi:hypothetical protein
MNGIIKWIREPITRSCPKSGWALQVSELALGLAGEYRRIKGSSYEHEGLADIQAAFVAWLNRSGKYLGLKEQLKEKVIQVVKERYKSNGECYICRTFLR